MDCKVQHGRMAIRMTDKEYFDALKESANLIIDREEPELTRERTDEEWTEFDHLSKKESWYDCEHEWTAYGDEDLGDVPGMGSRVAVVCVKCGCPGEMYEESGQVDWPTT